MLNYACFLLKKTSRLLCTLIVKRYFSDKSIPTNNLLTMNKKILFFLPLIALFIANVSCSDNNDSQSKLPEATTTGANTAGCYIDGKLFIPKDGEVSFSGTSYGLTIGGGINFNEPIVGDDYFYIHIVNFRDRPTYSLWLQMDNMIQGEGEYIVGQANGEYFVDGPSNPFIIAQYYDGENIAKTYYSSHNSGIIRITKFDYSNGIYSATFTGILYNRDNPADTIEITKGRFDIKIATLNQ